MSPSQPSRERADAQGRASFDAPILVRQLVRALRGKRSQNALSRRLGFRSNVLYAWESGRREPSASELFRIAKRTGHDLGAASSVFRVELEDVDLGDTAGVAALLEQLRGGAKLLDVAEHCGATRQTVSRWLRGETEPRASQFLMLIEALTLRLVDFVVSLVEPEAVPEIASAWAEQVAQREVAFQHPWSLAILRQLETRAYTRLAAHRVGWLARRLGVSRETERDALAALVAAGLVQWDGARWRSEPIAVDTSMASDEARRRLKLHWADVGRTRLAAGDDGLFSWAVVALSRSDYQRLRALHVEYMQSLRQLVRDSVPSEVVVVANVQLFALR